MFKIVIKNFCYNNSFSDPAVAAEIVSGLLVQPCVLAMISRSMVQTLLGLVLKLVFSYFRTKSGGQEQAQLRYVGSPPWETVAKVSPGSDMW